MNWMATAYMKLSRIKQSVNICCRQHVKCKTIENVDDNDCATPVSNECQLGVTHKIFADFIPRFTSIVPWLQVDFRRGQFRYGTWLFKCICHWHTTNLAHTAYFLVLFLLCLFLFAEMINCGFHNNDFIINIYCWCLWVWSMYVLWVDCSVSQ